MDEMRRLEALMARLRAKRGCPWDRRQTHKSLKPYLLEEAHEVLEAIDSRDPRNLREELGDLLLQVVFHAQIARERGDFGLSDVAAAISEKLLRRHPHVFGKTRIRTVGQLKRKWEELKQAEKPHRRSPFDGLPKSLPSLLRAQRVHEKITRRERPYADGRLERDLLRAWGQYRKARRSGRKTRLERSVGDFLLALARLSQSDGVHTEMALRRSLSTFEKRYRGKERHRS
jgi:tetrapyrrole methylase family protein/MazG family protein